MYMLIVQISPWVLCTAQLRPWYWNILLFLTSCIQKKRIDNCIKHNDALVHCCEVTFPGDYRQWYAFATHWQSELYLISVLTFQNKTPYLLIISLWCFGSKHMPFNLTLTSRVKTDAHYFSEFEYFRTKQMAFNFILMSWVKTHTFRFQFNISEQNTCSLISV